MFGVIRLGNAEPAEHPAISKGEIAMTDPNHVPNSMDYRRSYYERLAAGKVETNPPIPPLPMHPKQKGLRQQPLAVQLGMELAKEAIPPDPETLVEQVVNPDDNQNKIEIPSSNIPNEEKPVQHPGDSVVVNSDEAEVAKKLYDKLEDVDPFAV